MEILESLPPLLKTFWFIAIPVSIIFLIQTIMTFAGADAADGVQADFDSNLDHTEAPFQLFTFRNLINFLLGFSWAGISFYGIISSNFWLTIVALVTGVLFLVVFFLIIRQMQKLAEDNSFRYAQTLNRTAEVYMAIPGNRSGKGKVLVSIKGSTRELDAITEKEKIPAGAIVRVINIENDILLVELI